jgi:hypothetical protein
VRRAMPLNEPKSLRDEEVYAVVAYILLLNGVIGENDTIDAQTLPAVRKPTESRQREECPSEQTSSRFGLAISGRLPCPRWHRPVQPPRRARSAETEAARRKVHRPCRRRSSPR